ncbi:MAG: hypothetical protein P9M15_04815 [Candidatus Electryoneaceae bacterium]|nr:hypothetical protein [Candidatus Electryoneaceae bacterium]
MHRWKLIQVSLILLLFFLVLPNTGVCAVRTSIGVVGGTGLPTGWWAERWGLFQAGEVNVRYEFAPGTGILFFAGLGKTYLTSMSQEEVAIEARVYNQDEFDGNRAINTAYQGGSFKQLPIGFGLYREGLIGSLRGYGSAAMVVHLWKVERSQGFQETITGLDLNYIHYDNWYDEQDGADVGAQFAVGVLYPLQRLLFLDISLAYHWVEISREHSAIAYWGQPARTWDGDRLEEAKGRADFVQLRIGFRYGR